MSDLNTGRMEDSTPTFQDIGDLCLRDTPIRKGRPAKGLLADKCEQRSDAEPERNQVSSADEADDSTCAICLKQIPLAEVAQPVGCDHVYCTCCILHWANFKEKAWCPQCKTPFASILTFRTLDGQFHDQPCQEAVALLKYSQWFKDYVRMKEQTAAVNSSGRPAGAIIDESDYIDYARYYQEYDDDEEVEDYYFSSAAGRARVVIGNRRHGPNGYLSSGRMQARPTPPQASSSKASKGEGASQSGGSSCKSTPAKAAARVPSVPSRGSSKKKAKPSIRLDTDDESDGSGPSQRPQAMGRRARRSQKKAAADARVMS